MTTNDYKELDWSYTARCTKEWTDDELLSHLCSKAFTIPPRDYNPSAPFVYIRTEDGAITTLPHGYRLPLMFIAKYQWETTFRALSFKHRREWETVKDEVLHLSRLCHALFSKARATAESTGMEKGWRCVMFDRVLTRFYKGWPVSSPAKLESFLSHFSSKEYERDVLKYDWKRWVLKGFSRPLSLPVALTEDDINNGMTAIDFKIPLSKIDDVWNISTGMGQMRITFIRSTSSEHSTDYSELTDLDSSSDDVDLDDNEHPPIAQNLNPFGSPGAPTKRQRELPEGDNNNRSGKRTKLEEIVRSITPLPIVHSADMLDGREADLPKFKAPRQTLHSHGWKRLSTVEGRQQLGDDEREEEAVADVVLVSGVNNSSTSSNPPTSTAMNDPLSSTELNSKSVEDPLSTSLAQSNSKEQQLESAIDSRTSRNPKNSAYVSILSHLNFRTKPPASSSAIERDTSKTANPFCHLINPPPKNIKVEERNIPAKRPALVSPYRPQPQVASPQTRMQSRSQELVQNRGGTGSKEKEGFVKLRVLKKMRSAIQHPESSSSALANTALNNDGHVGQGKTTKTTAAAAATTVTASISDPPCHAVNPKSVLMADAGLSSESSFASPPTPQSASSGPLVPITDSSAVIATAIGGLLVPMVSDNSAAAAEPGSQQVKDRYRELKTRFFVLKDALEGIIGKLEGLEGMEYLLGDGDEGRGGISVGSENHPGFVSHTAKNRKRKENDNRGRDLDIEMIGVSESSVVNVDAAAGVDASIAFTDASVQTDGPTHVDLSAAAHTTIATADASSSTSLPATDELLNARNLKPTSLDTKNDETLHQFVNTASLSTMVDNLVSVKMLSMMQALVKSSGSANKLKLVETTTTTNEFDSDILSQPSPSTPSLSISGSIDTYDNVVASLLDELKTIKEEARCREQNEKDDLLAMRQLHSAEVDALRRRLAYLESRNLSLGRWENDGGRGRWRGCVNALDLDRHHHRYFLEDNNPDQQSPSFRQQYGDRHLSSSSSTLHPESEGSATRTINSTTTPQSSHTPLSFKKPNPSREAPATTAIDSSLLPTPSDRNHFSFSKNSHHHGIDVDDDIVVNPFPLPLPAKSQRKHHMMALARAQFS